MGCMLGLQLAYTGLGGLMIWPESAAWNNLAPSVFTAWSCATSVWFVREVVSVRRHSRPLARLLMGWGAFGVVLPVAYASLQNVPVLWILHGYMVISLLLAMGICLWAWRCGEKYALWVMAGFLPVIAMLPFPALRNIGMFPASFLTQYSLLIGSAVEIPLLLYVMHRRARELNEN
ncbi:MAG: 7TM-DISM domain-containing protein, partial [Rhodoferax sp.]|nr:7TM-DISM domain-containing protein [Rhodoferax sp.]